MSNNDMPDSILPSIPEVKLDNSSSNNSDSGESKWSNQGTSFKYRNNTAAPQEEGQEWQKSDTFSGKDNSNFNSRSHDNRSHDNRSHNNRNNHDNYGSDDRDGEGQNNRRYNNRGYNNRQGHNNNRDSDRGHVNRVKSSGFQNQDSKSGIIYTNGGGDQKHNRGHNNGGNNNDRGNGNFQNNRRYDNNRGNNRYNNSGNSSNYQHSNVDDSHIEIDLTKVISIKEYNRKTQDELLALLTEIGIDNMLGCTTQEMVFLILREKCAQGFILEAEGVLEVMSDGFGFLRSPESNYVSRADDIYLSSQYIKKYGLKTGNIISCYAREPKMRERYFAFHKIKAINGAEYNKTFRHPAPFDSLTPVYPKELLTLELSEEVKPVNSISGGSKADYSARIIDLTCPIGKGQRSLVVAPPRVGKTVLLKSIAHSINKNHPDVELIVLLIDERPEEVTDMSRSVKGEVVASTFDEQYSRHVALAEVVIEKAKRMVENGKDVVILLDSITRLARAYNNVLPSSGKVLTGGVDANALQAPKRFFGAARNIENGGSLTIVATALIETGSRMDEVIFEEFKGTGNSEIVLDRKIADKRIFPAIDILRSGTRCEEEMVEHAKLTKMWILRRILSSMSPMEAMEFFLGKLEKTSNNSDFFNSMNQ